MHALLLSLGLVAVLTLAELRWAARRDPTARKTNLAAWALYTAAGVAFQPATAALTVLVANAAGGGLVDLARWPLWAGAVGFTVAMDLGEYLFHRAQHALPWLWGMHSLHHSDPNMNATTGARHFWAEPLLKAVTIWLAVGLVFKATPEILAVYSLVSLYHFFSHANLNVNFGRWSWLLNSPAYHRVHHSAEPADYGSNYAALFPAFDMVLGSYCRPLHVPKTGLPSRPTGLIDIVVWPLRVGRLT
ncbi:sterol desaturase family protein [Phenylobacterium sp.]|jgi:sterol desaturase/sphingolipid hydroxylase (fatty acid hydroxylase superfamily)|uniref:sterol desaturase family protein n=1 Tax=Phenylobacterium sp. TaxID=1871053 RepID=UPI002F40DF72